MSETSTAVGPPMAMLAELTHRCPLACVYCSNPLELTRAADELSTAEWTDVFRQAADLGVLQLHLSGGEPAARRDLVALTEAAADAGLYTNLITSGIGLTEARIADLVAVGLDHLQLSMQGTGAAMTERVAAYRGGFARKLTVAAWTVAAGLPLTVNAVIHRLNIEDLPRMIDLAVEMGARRLEIANVQFHGWAARNRSVLLPTREQAEMAAHTAAQARQALAGTLAIDFVPPDTYAIFPKACMGGWGRVGLNIAPDGKVLPCHAAETIPALSFDTVRDRPLAEIWYAGEAFNAFRGEDWMQAPCRTCARRTVDFGGCRCQAMALVGDAAATDPVCRYSPRHGDVVAPALRNDDVALIYRRP